MILTSKIVTDEGTFKTNGRPLGKPEDVRNYIERHSERYLIADLTSIKNAAEVVNEMIDKIPNPKEFFGKDFEKIKKAVYENEGCDDEGSDIIGKWLFKHTSGELKWIGFKMLHFNEKCVLNKETGEMFTID